MTELWIVPEDASPPRPSPTLPGVRDFSLPLRFDEECLDCDPAVFIDRPIFKDGVKNYAKALRARPHSRARIILYPNRRDGMREQVADLKRAKSLLSKKYGIEARRIITVVGRRRESATIEFWIVS